MILSWVEMVILESAESGHSLRVPALALTDDVAAGFIVGMPVRGQ